MTKIQKEIHEHCKISIVNSVIYSSMKNLIPYSQFLLEAISSEITGMEKLFGMIDGPERKQLEGSGRLIDISIQNIQNPIGRGNSNEYLTFTFSDIPTPIPYIFLEFNREHTGYTILKNPSKIEIKNYFLWVDSVIQNNYFTPEKIDKITAYFYGLNPEYYIPLGSAEVLYCYYDKYKREVKFLDISDRSYQNLTEYSDLIKLGATEVTTSRQLKNGTIALKFGNRTVMIHSNGYVRTSFGDRVSVLFKTPEANKPIETSDDLSLKMRMIHLFLLKNDVLKPEGIDSKTIKLVTDSYVSPNSTNYKEVYDMLVRKNPKLSLYLTPPSDGYNKNMIKGAGLLKSVGIF